MHYDKSRLKWIRSGKDVGSRHSNPRRTFKLRHEEHKKESLTTKGGKHDKSNFHSCYPSKTLAGNSNDCRRKGHSENLVQCCGVDFDRNSDATSIVLVIEDDDVFAWSKEMLEKVEKLKLSTCTELKYKQLVMIGFLFELGYDLMIISDDNVSESPGFKPCLGNFGGSS